ncbi:MAG: hypothetical protein RIS36_798 [Pseudomonadota bacterium]|jgi:hypothetical protein
MKSSDEEILIDMKRRIAELLEQIAANPLCPIEMREEINNYQDTINDLKE